MMGTVCIDTNVLIYAIQGRTEQQNERANVCTALMHKLKRERTNVVLPSICVGEFLLHIDEREHNRYHELFTRLFTVVPYDGRASMRFAEIWRKRILPHIGGNELEEYFNRKTALRADTMLVATAVTYGATRIYSFDQGIRKIATDFVQFEDLNAPTEALQLYLLAGSENID